MYSLIHAWYLVFKYPIQQYHMLPFGIGEGRFNRESSSIDLEVGIPDSPGSQSSMLTSAETPGSLQSAKRSSSFASGRNSSDKKKSSAKSGRKSQAKDRRKSSVSASTSRWDRFTSILDFPDPTQQPPPGDYDDYRETINQAAIASAKLKANGKNKKSHKKRNSHKKKKSPNDDTTASLLSSRSIEQMEIHSDNSASSNGKKSHDNDNTPLL
ncbi:hypothetical protein H4219_000365 [Mycoemilia scoparia]|uniref:Uncharacterized protein n=1 Tax=Mycoemilia scoparia TaxID=417184 RepID=A0A9W8ACB1_9FUNG|nr:hypothetical protein H4219_000365 [Mycoemilia scoparia]